MKTACRHPDKPAAPGAAVGPATMKPVEVIGIKSVIATLAHGSFDAPGTIKYENVRPKGSGFLYCLVARSLALYALGETHF